MKNFELIDSHCHIVFKNFEEDIDLVAERWRAAGISSLLHACVEPSEIELIKTLADKFPELRYAVGVHPLDTKKWKSNTISILRNAAKIDHRVVAIGELGLDFFKDSNVDEQIAILKPQLDLSLELGLPIIVHCRDAAKKMLELFQIMDNQDKCPQGVMHCWGGSLDEMNDFLDLGFYISFSGTVTFSKAKVIQECAKEVPMDKFLIETDCPFLSPSPHRGKRNEPANVRFVAEKIAEIKNKTFEEIANSSSKNARKLFDLP